MHKLATDEGSDLKCRAEVVIFVLNWNRKNDTLECLHSLFQLKHANYNLIVIDNASTDGSVEAIKKRYPEIFVIKNDTNLGYAGGNNVGMRYCLVSKAQYFVILNNDTILHPLFLDALVDAAERNLDGGIFGAKALSYSEPDKIWSTGATFSTEVMDFVNIREKDMSLSSMEKCEEERAEEIDIAVGYAMLLRTEMLRNIGLFDEDFYLMHEESDLCFRARDSGYKIYHVPNAILWHKGSVSFGGDESPLHQYFWSRNRLLWGKKHLRFLMRTRLFFYVLKDLLVDLKPNQRLMVKGRKIHWGLLTYWKVLRQRTPRIKANLAGIRDYLLGRFGNCPENIRTLNKQ